MTLHILTSLIEAVALCCIIFAVLAVAHRQKANEKEWEGISHYFHVHNEQFARNIRKMETRLVGKFEKAHISSRIAEKTADRAFSLASSATLGVVALQKALAVPRLLTKHQTTANQLAKNDIDELFKVKGAQDWLRPLMSDKELDILDRAEAEAERQRMNQEESDTN